MNRYLEALRQKEQNWNEPPRFDFITECILCQDHDLLQLVDCVKSKPKFVEKALLEELQFECINETHNIKDELENLHDSEKSYLNNLLFYAGGAKITLKKFRITSIEEYIAEYKEECFALYSEIYNAPSEKTLAENAIYYRICKYLFENYKRKMNREEFDFTSLMPSDDTKTALNEVFGGNALCRYDLLKVNVEDLEIVDDYFPHLVVRNQVGYNFCIDRRISGLGSLFHHLIDMGFVTEIAFKIESVMDDQYCAEELLYGKKFTFDLTELPSLSKFYDVKAQEDNVWVTVEHSSDKFSITFEETLEDTFYDKNSMVITHVVHLEVTKSGDEDVISHLDHEYIVYELDTYISRLDNPTTKGETKIKTFKIDNARIPLKHKFQEVNVLYIIVKELLNKKELVTEYFENAL